MILDAVVVRSESSLPQQDCWLLYEKYADSLPIANEIRRKSPAPPYEPCEFPQQRRKHRFETVKEVWHQFASRCYQFLQAVKKIVLSEEATIILVFLCLILLLIFIYCFMKVLKRDICS
ncbi:hypothetical protein HG536_0C02430 [Torulaspora globosa]|uniref:Uncharacterized protein n=1 Tax=Torulaspora globosa TaxID=48254 RepID=A0A7G3ZEY8_9SACH|nr:uncharacterized protein HG536_0C02430 [Torulaspora globosa]QLL32074.1 hypothetical protein HG536_0C02430 [Torulaspora globosa]